MGNALHLAPDTIADLLAAGNSLLHDASGLLRSTAIIGDKHRRLLANYLLMQKIVLDTINDSQREQRYIGEPISLIKFTQRIKNEFQSVTSSCDAIGFDAPMPVNKTLAVSISQILFGHLLTHAQEPCSLTITSSNDSFSINMSHPFLVDSPYIQLLSSFAAWYELKLELSHRQLQLAV